MKPTKEINLDELREYKRTHTAIQCAKHFGVSKSTIDKRLKPTEATTSFPKSTAKSTVMGLAGLVQPGSIDPNTALLFIQQENSRLLADSNRYKAERNEAQKKIEDLKEKTQKLEREVENLTKEVGSKPTALAGLGDAFSEGFKTDPAGTIKAIGELLGTFKNQTTQQPQIAGPEFPDAAPDFQLYLKGVVNMLSTESHQNPQRFIQLFYALSALTKVENQAILIQLQPPPQQQQ